MQDWIENELETSEIGDARLDARYEIIMNDLSVTKIKHAIFLVY